MKKVISSLVTILLFLGFASVAIQSSAAVNCSTDFCVFSNLTSSGGSTGATTDSPVAVVSVTTSANEASCEKSSTSCGVFAVVGNEIQAHDDTSGCDPACYSGNIHKSYEYTYVETNVNKTISTGIYLGTYSLSSPNNNIYWNAVNPAHSTDGIGCAGSCITGGTEFGTVGQYLSTALDGRQYEAQLADCNHQSIQNNQYSCISSRSSTTYDPSSKITTQNSNEERHSVYWLVGNVKGISMTNGSNVGGHPNTIPQLEYVAAAFYYNTATSPNKFQIVFFMSCPNTDCAHNLNVPGSQESDGGAVMTATAKDAMEWAIYSPPSDSYQANLYPSSFGLGGYFAPQSLSNPSPHNGAYWNSGTKCTSDSSNGFCNSAGNNYAFYTLGFHVTTASGGAMSVDQIIDTSSQCTVGSTECPSSVEIP